MVEFFQRKTGSPVPFGRGENDAADRRVRPSVDFILAMPEVAVQFALVSDEELSQELEDYGAWSNAELKDRKENIRRVLWLSLSELHDELESQ